MESTSAFNLNRTRSAQDHSISLHKLRCNPKSHPISPSFYSNFTPSIVNRFDRIATLGSYDPVNEELIGHSGCVNALDWNRDGSLLATGSDDRNIILWGMGIEDDTATSGSKENGNRRGRGNVRRGDVDSDQEESDLDEKEMKDRPKIDIGIKSVIETGHRANIFSVKFAPQSSSILFSCAGDRQVRVFDLNSASAFSTTKSNPSGFGSYQHYSEDSNACIRIYKCHRGRAKRIETQFSPDTFLTCSEDGDVREFDLRLKHDCSSSNCPPPIASFPFSLYSISISKASPWLFIAAGTSPYAYLQDRRMNPRILKEEWGVKMDGNDETSLSKCVRRFGIPEDGFDGDGNQEVEVDDESGEDDDEDERKDEEDEMREERSGRRKRRKLEMNRKDRMKDAHITAAKISQHSEEEELILSYSPDAIYRFKLSDPPAQVNKANLNFSTHQSNRFKSSNTSESRFIPSASSSTQLKALREEMIEYLFPRSANLKSLAYMNSRLSKLSDLQSSIQETTKSKKHPFSTTEMSTALAKALLLLKTYPPGVDEAGTALLPFVEHSNSVLEISRILEEEFSHAFDWENRAQMNQILDRIWELAEPVIRDGWKEEEVRESSVEDQMQIDEQVASSTEESDTETPQDQDQEASEEETISVDDGSDEAHSESGSESDPDGIFARQQRSESKKNFNKSIPIIHPISKYSGHRNIETVKDVNYLGNKDQYVITGSDDGNFFIYEKSSSELIGIYKADSSVVNVLQPHPSLPLLAVSGIDDTPRIFGPIKPNGKKLNDKMEEKEEIVRKNMEMNETNGISERLSARNFIRFLQSHRLTGGEIEEGDECVIA